MTVRAAVAVIAGLWLLSIGWPVLVGAVVLCYVAACWWFPFRACLSCRNGKRRSDSGRTFRYCRWCRGTGGRLRYGRRMFNYFRQSQRASTR